MAANLPARKTRKDFQRLAGLRAKEAIALARSRNHQGAYYLAGLAIECALKACIAKKTRRHDFPLDVKQAGKVYSHDLPELLKLANLAAPLDQEMSRNEVLAENWFVVRQWRVDCRYQTSGLNGRGMIAAMTGVLEWFKLHW